MLTIRPPCTAIWQQPLQSVLALRSCSVTDRKEKVSLVSVCHDDGSNVSTLEKKTLKTYHVLEDLNYAILRLYAEFWKKIRKNVVVGRQRPTVYTTGAQITLLRGNASVPHPLLWRNEVPTCSVVNSKRLFLYTMCCRRGCQCFSVIRTRKSDVIVT